MKEEGSGQKAKRGLFRFVFSRIGIILLLILVQIGLFFVMSSYLRNYVTFIYAGRTVLEAVAIVFIINSKDNPAFKLTWILCIMIFPIAGALFYIFVKVQLETRYVRGRLSELRSEIEPYMQQNQDTFDGIWASKSANSLLSTYLCRQLGYPTYRNTAVKYFPLGEDKFVAMIEELKKAKKFIFMEYFIVEKGDMWHSVLKVLKEKAAEGVEVRFMYDGMCAISMLPYNYPEELQKYGIQAKMVNKIRPFLSTVQNNRDHRKICVIDGKVAFTGGVNLGDEYINRKERFGHWKDTAVMLKGDAVQSFTMMFLQMWNLDTKDSEDYRRYLTPKRKSLHRELGYVIPYGDSPYDDENVGEEVYFHILNHAKKYVHIMTPYLILDNEMITTLKRVAKSGVEVIIIMPHIPDKWYAFVVAQTYYEELIEAGVKIFEYTPGFVHAKVFVSDNDTATVGTINLDFRSLYLHFECGVFIYNNMEVEKIERDFQKTLRQCHKVSLLEVHKRTLYSKIMGRLLRLIAPLM